jgi:hypothetical protein
MGIFCGNNVVQVNFPDRTRVLKAPAHEDVLLHPKEAIREALSHPLNHEPVRKLVGKGARVLIAFDDLAVPVPPMPPPDNRQQVISVLLEELYAEGVQKKDITLVCANGIHRMWKRTELRTILGDPIMQSFGPGQLLGHDGEDPSQLIHLGLTENGYEVEINRRVVDSDQTFYVNINWVPFNGGWKSTVVGLGTYRSIRYIHNPEIYLGEWPASCMEPDRNHLHARIREMGVHLETYLAKKGKKIFQIETALNSTLPPKMSAIFCGNTPDVHEKTLDYLNRHKTLQVEGQSDVLVFGLPDFMPYSIGTIINPILIARMGLGYLFSNYRNKPLVRKGGMLVLSNPLYDQVDPIHHPSYKTFWEEGFARTRDAHLLYDLFADEYANRPEFVHRYRFGYGFHGAHPIQAYTTTITPKRYLGKIMAAGCRNASVAEKLEWQQVESVEKALEIAEAEYGKDCSITYVTLPPLFLPVVS